MLTHACHSFGQGLPNHRPPMPGLLGNQLHSLPRAVQVCMHASSHPAPTPTPIHFTHHSLKAPSTHASMSARKTATLAGVIDSVNSKRSSAADGSSATRCTYSCAHG